MPGQELLPSLYRDQRNRHPKRPARPIFSPATSKATHVIRLIINQPSICQGTSYTNTTTLYLPYTFFITDKMDFNDEDGPPELVDANEAAAIVEQADNIKVPLTLVTGI